MSVSWFGVHRVLLDDSADPPNPLVLTVAAPSALPSIPALPSPSDGGPSDSGSPGADPSGTGAPTPSGSTSPAHSSRPSAAPTTPGPSTGQADQTAGPTPDPTGGKITSYTPVGGLIVASVGVSSASFVSATPSAGWSVSWVPGDHYFRVDFQRGGTDSVFYITWNGHPPLVQAEVLGG